MMTERTPQDVEQSLAGWSQRMISALTEAEVLASYGATAITEANRDAGRLIQGYRVQPDGSTEAVEWSDEQMAAAQDAYALPAAAVAWFRTPDESGVAPMQRLLALAGAAGIGVAGPR